MAGGEELVLPPLGLPGPAPAALRRAPRLRPARVPRQRGPELHRRRAARLLDQPRHADVGRLDPVGPGSGRLRLGRCADQLPERALLRARRRSRPLAGESPAREGHPPLPLRLLAGDAALGRVRAAAAAVRPRLPQPRQPEDLEVARQRARSARPRRRVRRRPGALLGRAGRPVRPGRRRHARRLPRALRAGARERPRQPALADDGDDRPLPRRRAARRRRTSPATSPGRRGRCRKGFRPPSTAGT